MLKEFKAFVMRGNVVDLAVAVIIGGAFGAIVGSLINDIITPLLLNPVIDSLGLKNLEELKWHGAAYGKFLASVINFLVIALVIFLMIKGMNKASKKKTEETPAAPPAPTMDQELLMEIRDLLKK